MPEPVSQPPPPPDANSAGPRPLVELRIHGVSGTPPAGMLDARAVSLRAGDATTGFYAPDPDETVTGVPGDRSRRLEGYSWRGMTSGSPLQALWVLLAPFALANTAAAMRPRPRTGARPGRAGAVHAALLRLFGLSLTLTLVTAAYVTSIDEVAWQCGNDSTCISGHSLTKYLGWRGLDSPARRIAVTLCVPLAAIVLLWLLARRAWNARAAVLAVAGKRDLAHVAAASQRTPLDDPALWEDREPSEFLRHAHVAAAFDVVSAMTAIAVAYQGRGSLSGVRILAVAATVLLGIAGGLVAVGWRETRWRWRRFVSVGVLVGSIIVFAALVAVLVSDPGVEAPRRVSLPGVESAILWLFVAQLVVVIAIGVVGVASRIANRDGQVGLWGAGGAFVSGLALVSGAMFSAGIVLRVGDYLGQTSSKLADVDHVRHVVVLVPNALIGAALGTVLFVGATVAVAALVALGWIGVRVFRAAPGFARAASRFLAGGTAPEPAGGAADARARQVARARRLARMTDRAGPIVVGPAVLALCVAAATSVVVVLIDSNRYTPAFLTHSGWIADHATAYGSWMITAFAVGMLLVVLRARSNESLRRKVGILWDLTTFWPRHAQPLGPPCYTDRALPELVFRITWHVKEREEDVIVSAHSQGSIIAAPVLLQLRASVRDRVALLTHGSPLHRLYARWFPAWFDDATFEELDARLSRRWWNLFRDTDPIGGNIPGAAVNAEIEPDDVIPSGDYVYPPIRVHSDYAVEPKYADAVGALDRELRTGPSSSP